MWRREFEIGLHDGTCKTGSAVHASMNELIETNHTEIRRRRYLMSYEDSYAGHIERVTKEFAGLARQG